MQNTSSAQFQVDKIIRIWVTVVCTNYCGDRSESTGVELFNTYLDVALKKES